MNSCRGAIFCQYLSDFTKGLSPRPHMGVSISPTNSILLVYELAIWSGPDMSLDQWAWQLLHSVYLQKQVPFLMFRRSLKKLWNLYGIGTFIGQAPCEGVFDEELGIVYSIAK